MQDSQISPLAQRLADGSGIDWQQVQGSGDGGSVTERDVLDHMVQLMKDPSSVHFVAPVTAAQPGVEAAAPVAGLVSANGSAERILLEELEAAQFQLEQERSAHEATQNQLAQTSQDTAAIDSAKRRIAELEQLLQQRDQELAQLRQQQSGAEEMMSRSRQDAEGYTQQVRALEAELRNERTEIDRLRQEFAAMRGNMQQMQAMSAQVKPLSDEIKRIGTALSEANIELERLRPIEMHYTQLEDEVIEARQAHLNSQSQVDELRQQVNELQTKRSGFRWPWQR